MNFMTFVINLDRSHERLQTIQNELQREEIKFQRIVAIDGKALPVDQPHLLLQVDDSDFERELTLGEIGCALSHTAALRAFLGSSADFALILEDDVVLSRGFKDIIQSFLIWASTSGTKFHVANLGQMAKRPFSPLLDVFSHSFGRSHYYPMTTAALLWSRQGAEAFLDANPKITAPIDIQFRQWIGRSGEGFGVRPALVRQSGVSSDIEERKNPKDRRSLRYRTKSYRRKFREKADAMFSYAIHELVKR